MAKTNRRDILRFGSASLAFPLLAILDVGCTPNEDGTTGSMEPVTDNESTENKKETDTGAAMKIQYLEIVSPDVDAICKTYEQLHGVKFGEPDANLGNARTAKLPNGGLLGVRAPLRDTEEPIVRPYFLVEDIEASVSKAADSGAEIALPPMELPGHGRCAIFTQGGAEHGRPPTSSWDSWLRPSHSRLCIPEAKGRVAFAPLARCDPSRVISHGQLHRPKRQ